MKHTPGKWELNLPCTDEVVADLGGNDISIARHIKNPADARLIAVAPELVDVLQEMTKRYANLEHLYFEALNLLDRSETNGTINRAQNLLARIEGKP